MIGSLFSIIVISIIIYLILKFVKKVIHLVFSFVFLFIIISSLFGFLVYTDFKDLRENMNNQTSIIILKDNQNYIVGSYIKLEEISDNSKIQQINDVKSYESISYKQILAEKYKLIIIDITFLENNLESNLDYKDYSITKIGIINILRSNEPENELAGIINTPKDQISYKGDELKLQIFLGTINQMIEKQGFGIIIKGYKNKEIVIYPESFAFKFMKILPSAYINNYFTN